MAGRPGIIIYFIIGGDSLLGFGGYMYIYIWHDHSLLLVIVHMFFLYSTFVAELCTRDFGSARPLPLATRPQLVVKLRGDFHVSAHVCHVFGRDRRAQLYSRIGVEHRRAPVIDRARCHTQKVLCAQCGCLWGAHFRMTSVARRALCLVDCIQWRLRDSG